ncbi:MAG: 1-acyl-sn-glycerol-3-phosphate acyltransferase [Proteobacteria bacterium]|nr:1-acyl-sn-glycerol-3-phosphate acyltransferase [Pseudomonadota bacterium]
MSFLRSLVFLLFQIVVTPVFAILMLATAWLPRVQRYETAAAWCGMMLVAARAICGIRWRVEGLANIPSTPHIIMCKHSSTWETLSLHTYFPPLSFIAKKELLKIPFFGWGFALASPITIDRKAGADAMQQMAVQARERFAQGFWIVIYPEGTRIKAGTHVRYKTGGARLALLTDTPILPIAHNAGYLWPKGIFGKRPGTITLSIGAPIAPEGRDPAALTALVEQWIEDEVARLGVPAAA